MAGLRGLPACQVRYQPFLCPSAAAFCFVVSPLALSLWFPFLPFALMSTFSFGPCWPLPFPFACLLPALSNDLAPDTPFTYHCCPFYSLAMLTSAVSVEVLPCPLV